MKSINVIGRGRVGTAVASRLEERGVELRDDAELVLLCVPDRAIVEVAREIEPGPWLAHVSGATPLAALDPHERRFSMHPLQTFTLSRGPEQLDGAWAAVTAETGAARALGWELAQTLGLKPFDLEDGARTPYHAGHVALFAAAREENELVVASLFVNPAQFADPRDLARYPRDEAADAAIAEEAGVDLLFAPAGEEMYPRGYETWVELENASRGLDGLDVDYVEVAPFEPPVLAAAVRVGSVRLIDNVPLDEGALS